MLRKITAAIVLGLLGAPAHAALLGRLPATAGGTDYQAYYDTALNVTWIADPNLAVTAGYDSDGAMTWPEAQAWISSLDAQDGGIGFRGVNDWRLPTLTDTGTPGCNFAYSGTDCGYNVNVATGEMASMFYGTLGNSAGYDNSAVQQPCFTAGPQFCLANVGPFPNLQRDQYWYGTEYAPDTALAWAFNFSIGLQSVPAKDGHNRAWLVRNGDIGAVTTDSDADGVANPLDNCPATANPDQADSDGDGRGNGCDNCTLVANANQFDADGDGNGNICDGDLNNSGLTTATDFNLLRSCLNQPATASALCAAADMNGSGAVTATDFNLLRIRINTAPGPSGLHP